ncbi:hypothetical protein [Enterococcus rivorum]|uniref:hypothetical protein n=1 Tax=Enterococcus rivorum TaxID=762845 RepID=UPI0036258760
MSSGNYTIPMSEYYSKSNEFKGKVQEVVDNVQQNFLKKVSDNINNLDSEDQSFLEGCSAYTQGKKIVSTLQDKHLQNLGYMSNENGQNPLHKVVDDDKKFASKFNAIAQGKASNEVTAALGAINRSITTQKNNSEFISFLNGISDQLSSDEVKSLMRLAKLNPEKAWQTLLNSEQFIEVIGKNAKVQDLFLSAMISLEKAGNLPAKFMDILIDSPKFVDFLSKAPMKIQNGVLDVMTFIADKGWTITKTTEKFTGWVKTVAELKPLKILTKFAGTKLGAVVTSPWAAIGVTAGISAFDAYNAEGKATHKDLGKSVTCGVIDGITSIGPVEGALIGASVGGPWGHWVDLLVVD